MVYQHVRESEKVKVSVLSHVQPFVTPWTVAHQTPLSMRILQAIPEWVAMPFSRESSWPRHQTQISCIAGGFFTVWATFTKNNTFPGYVCVSLSHHYLGKLVRLSKMDPNLSGLFFFPSIYCHCILCSLLSLWNSSLINSTF